MFGLRVPLVKGLSAYGADDKALEERIEKALPGAIATLVADLAIADAQALAKQAPPGSPEQIAARITVLQMKQAAHGLSAAEELELRQLQEQWRQLTSATAKSRPIAALVEAEIDRQLAGQPHQGKLERARTKLALYKSTPGLLQAVEREVRAQRA